MDTNDNENSNETFFSLIIHVILFLMPFIIFLIVFCTKKCISFDDSTAGHEEEPLSQLINIDTTDINLIQIDEIEPNGMPPAYNIEMNNNFENLPSYDEVQKAKYSSQNNAFSSDSC
jgi:hypothetical protein